MSGPKISAYSLTGRAKEIVFGQMRCEQQSLACAAQMQAILKSLSAYSESFDQLRQNIELLIKRTGDGADQLESLTRLQESLKSRAEEITAELCANMPSRSVKYQITEEAFAEKQAKLKKLQMLRKRTESLKQAFEEVFENEEDEKNQRKSTRSEKNHASLETDAGTFMQDNKQINDRILHSILSDLSGVFSFDLTDEPDNTEKSFADRKAAVSKRLSELLGNASLPEDIVTDIKRAVTRLQAITDAHSLTTFDSITVTGLYKRIADYKKKAKEKEELLSELRSRYKALCVMIGVEAKELPSSGEPEALLKDEIERLELIAVRQQEQVYISDCVDEVMEEMGYDLIGKREVRKRSGKHFRNELFTFDEGTAVNITFSSDGQISMELGGLAREDRIPSPEEAEILKRDMESFCGEFAEFERRLRAKGVVLGERIALSPSSTEYAAIININDYDTGENIQIPELNAKEKRRKTAEKKTMRREE